VGKLPGDYIAGFVDGEGHFGLNFRRDIKYKRKGRPVYHRWIPVFAISMSSDDKKIVEDIRDTLGCGIISVLKGGRGVYYAVNDFGDILNKVIPFFDRHKLRAKKAESFRRWKEAVFILAPVKKRHADLFKPIAYTGDEEVRLEQIKSELRKLHGLTKEGKVKGRPRY